MSLAAMQEVVARLLAEPGFVERFRDDPAAATEGLDVTPEDLGVLRRLDLSRIGMVCEGYAGKRAERIRSAHPWTLRALGHDAEAALAAHLAAFPAGRDEPEELAAFADLAARTARPAWRRRLVRDLLDVEARLRAAPPQDDVPPMRWSGQARLRLAPGVALARTRGDLAAALAANLALDDYPPTRRHVLVRSTPRGLDAHVLEPREAAALAACEAGATVADAARDPDDEAHLRRWTARGILLPRPPAGAKESG